MNSTQFHKPPGIPLISPSSVFDHRPVARHGRNEFGMRAAEGRAQRIPDIGIEEWCLMPKVIPLMGFSEVGKPIYQYPEVTGAIMKPPARTNQQIARVSAATYEIESEQILRRLAGKPPMHYTRQWDQSYERYMY